MQSYFISKGPKLWSPIVVGSNQVSDLCKLGNIPDPVKARLSVFKGVTATDGAPGEYQLLLLPCAPARCFFVATH